MCHLFLSGLLTWAGLTGGGKLLNSGLLTDKYTWFSYPPKRPFSKKHPGQSDTDNNVHFLTLKVCADGVTSRLGWCLQSGLLTLNLFVCPYESVLMWLLIIVISLSFWPPSYCGFLIYSWTNATATGSKCCMWKVPMFRFPPDSDRSRTTYPVTSTSPTRQTALFVFVDAFTSCW